jgi:MoxR-like ATPase
VEPATVQDVRDALAAHQYLADTGLATAVFLAMTLRRPLLLEGEAGVGKTELAKVLADWTGGELVRLQCYEGIDAAQAVYEWDYSRQLLHLRAQEARGDTPREDELYSEQFLVRRPLLRAIGADGAVPPVLLVDEVDRADDEFEAFLLEILADYTITVPELGTFRAERPPIVVVTSNRTRDVHDALKRRCLYHWIEHPDFERELAILRVRAPGVGDALARQVAAAVAALRDLDLYKPPGVAETIDWAQAVAALGADTLDEDTIEVTLGTVVKYREDQQRVRAHGLDTLAAAGAGDG